jgi:Na+/melibiose symporter-like transporter
MVSHAGDGFQDARPSLRRRGHHDAGTPAPCSTLIETVLCAFLFGWLTDRLGRKKLFTIAFAVYLVAAVAEALWGVAAERKSLEAVARPLAFVD